MSEKDRAELFAKSMPVKSMPVKSMPVKSMPVKSIPVKKSVSPIIDQPSNTNQRIEFIKLIIKIINKTKYNYREQIFIDSIPPSPIPNIPLGKHKLNLKTLLAMMPQNSVSLKFISLDDWINVEVEEFQEGEYEEAYLDKSTKLRGV